MDTYENIIKNAVNVISLGKKTSEEIEQTLQHMTYLIKLKMLNEEYIRLLKSVEVQRRNFKNARYNIIKDPI